MTAGRASEPRVLVSGWKDGRWAAKGRTVDEALATGVQSWVYAFDGDYVGHRELTRADLESHDVVIVNMSRPFAPLVRLAGERPATTRWVSLVEFSAHEYFLPQRDLKALLDSSDLVDVINRHSLPLFRALTRSRVEYIGMPYPVDGVGRLSVPVEARRQRIFLCAHLSRQWNEYLAARAIGLPHYGYEIEAPRPRGRARLAALVRTRAWRWDRAAPIRAARALYRELFDDQALGVTTYTKDPTSYFTENADARFWISLDSRYTWSRFVLDAAALRVPLITTAATSHGELLFPETTVAHAMDLDRVIDLGRRLSTDPDFYARVAAYPADRMDFLRAGPMKRALLGALGVL